MINKRKPTALHEWLEIATKGLESSAKNRVWMEVLAHYEDAVAAHQEEGLPEPKAHRAALNELGDVSAARKSFRRMHLLASEAKCLRRVLERKWTIRFTLFVYFGFAVMTTIPMISIGALKAPFLNSTNLFLLGTGFFFLLLSPAVAFILSRRQNLPFATSMGLICDCLERSCIMVTVYVWLCWLPATLPWQHGIGYSLIICWFLLGVWRGIRLAKKVPSDWLKPIEN